MLLFESQGFIPINFSVVNGFKFISWNSRCWSSNRTRQFSYSKTTFLKMTQALPNNYPSFLPVLFKFSELPYIYLKFSLDWRYSFPSLCNIFFVKFLFLWDVCGARYTDDVRQSIEGDATFKFPSLVLDITVTYYCQQNKQSQYISVNHDILNFNLSLILWIFQNIGFAHNFYSL